MITDLAALPLPMPWTPGDWAIGRSEPTPAPRSNPARRPPVVPPATPADGDDDDRGGKPFRTVAMLRDPETLWTGSLDLHRRGPEPGRPYLFATVWCVHCRHPHNFPWPDEAPLDAIIPIDLPCRDDSIRDRPAFLTLDPAHPDSHRRAFIQFRRLLERHQKSNLVRFQFRPYSDPALYPPPSMLGDMRAVVHRSLSPKGPRS